MPCKWKLPVWQPCYPIILYVACEGGNRDDTNTKQIIISHLSAYQHPKSSLIKLIKWLRVVCIDEHPTYGIFPPGSGHDWLKSCTCTGGHARLFKVGAPMENWIDRSDHNASAGSNLARESLVPALISYGQINSVQHTCNELSMQQSTTDHMAPTRIWELESLGPTKGPVNMLSPGITNGCENQ